MKPIYLDYAAATPVADPVKKQLRPFLSEQFGNPSSLHSFGKAAKTAVQNSRATVANFLNALPEEVIFTGSGTESINLALKGYIGASKKKQHIISSTIEHSATLEVLDALKAEGHTISHIPCDEAGLVSVETVISSITDDTTLISIIFAQNEIGTVQPIAEIGKQLTNINRERIKKDLPYIAFHTDACQAAPFIDLNVQKLHVDLLTFNGSKLYAPKGIGVLYKKRPVQLVPLIHGGGQEFKLRSGTESTQLIVAIAAACEYARSERNAQSARLTVLRDNFFTELKKFQKIKINGDTHNRLPNNINFSVPNIDGERIVLDLSNAGIAVSTGSACSSAALEPSHIMAALNLPKEYTSGSIRITLGYPTTKKEVQTCLTKLSALL